MATFLASFDFKEFFKFQDSPFTAQITLSIASLRIVKNTEVCEEWCANDVIYGVTYLAPLAEDGLQNELIRSVVKEVLVKVTKKPRRTGAEW